MIKLNRRITAALTTVLLGGFSMVAAAQQGVTAGEILLGEILPLTGPASVGSLGLSAGTKVAIAEANASGGVNGRKLRLISEDDGLVVARAIQAARKLVTVDKVFALTSTSGSAASSALLPMLKETGIPAFNFLSFPTSFHTPVVPNIYVGGASHQDTMEQLVRQLAARYPNKKWAISLPDDEFGSLMGEGVDRARKDLNLTVVHTASYRRTQKDFSAEILAAVNAGAEILVTGAVVTETIAMLKELDRLGKKIPVGLSWVARNSPTIHEMMGPAFENVYLIDYVVADESAQGRDFMARAARFLSESDLKRVNRFSFVGYAGTTVLIEAMRRCGSDLTWACTIKELDSTKSMDTGVMAPISFTPTSHFATQALTLMKANAKTFSFEPIR